MTSRPPEEASDPVTEALRLQQEARALGFDWNHADELWAKLDEEIGELRAAHAEEEGAERVLDEFGDLLFVALNLSRHLDVDPVAALAAANEKFRRRFGHVMAGRASWNELQGADRVAQMEVLWQEAKRKGL